jgi:hypothetical protein
MSDESDNDVMAPIPSNHPLMRAWNLWKDSCDYITTKAWAAEEEHAEGSLWHAFELGWQAAQKTLEIPR